MLRTTPWVLACGLLLGACTEDVAGRPPGSVLGGDEASTGVDTIATAGELTTTISASGGSATSDGSSTSDTDGGGDHTGDTSGETGDHGTGSATTGASGVSAGESTGGETSEGDETSGGDASSGGSTTASVGSDLDPDLDIAESGQACTVPGYSVECPFLEVCRFHDSEIGRCESCENCGNLGAPCSDGTECDILFACFAGRCTNFCWLGEQECGPPEDCLDVGHPSRGVCDPLAL